MTNVLLIQYEMRAQSWQGPSCQRRICAKELLYYCKTAEDMQERSLCSSPGGGRLNQAQDNADMKQDGQGRIRDGDTLICTLVYKGRATCLARTA